MRETYLLVVVVAALPHVVDLALGHGVVTAGAAAVALPEYACSRTIIELDRRLEWQLRSALTAEEILFESENIVEQPLSDAEDCAVVWSHLHQEEGDEHVSRLENIIIKQHRSRRATE